MTTNFLPDILTLFRECFEGKPSGQDYTWFVEGKEGIFDALESTGAETASIKPKPECSSIAAHTFHIRFALRGANAYLGGPGQEGDWESSWVKQTVNEEEWTELKKDVAYQYQFFLDYFKNDPQFPNPESQIGFVAQLPHMAYHLGAIRQLMKIQS